MRIFRNIDRTKYFDSLDTLKILTFWDIIKTKNVLLLDQNFDKSKTYKPKTIDLLNDVWLKLYDEYYLLLNDTQSKMKMSKTFNELKLRDKIGQVKNNYDFLVNLLGYVGRIPDTDIVKYEQETYNRLKLIDKRIKPLYFEGIPKNLENLDRVLNSLINKYNLEHKTNEQSIQKEIDNVYDAVANAESWIERPIPIERMVVSHWVAIQNQIKEKQKSQQKNGK